MKTKNQLRKIEELGISKKQLTRILNPPKIKPRIIKDSSSEIFEFGVVSDTHFGSRLSKIDELHTFYEVCRKRKIQNVFHAGD